MKQVYEDYKYVMQDTGYLYIGSKYSYGELMENESVPFKFMTILERYILPDMGPDTTVEAHLYYAKPEDFTSRTLFQLKAKVYKTEVMSLQEFAKMTPDEKERAGIFIQELIISKLGLVGFLV